MNNCENELFQKLTIMLYFLDISLLRYIIKKIKFRWIKHLVSIHNENSNVLIHNNVENARDYFA